MNKGVLLGICILCGVGLYTYNKIADKPEQVIENASQVASINSTNQAEKDSEAPLPEKKNAPTTCKTQQDNTFTSPLLADLSEANLSEKILKREGYTSSYNPDNRQPNYVAWTLTPSRLIGSNKRKNTFFEDPELSDSEKSLLSDYYNSGYDRGHLCPAADNKWSRTAMIESFYLSNICPQTHTLNAGDWQEIEELCRIWVRRTGYKLHIISGPIFEEKSTKKLKKRIPVPSHFFKALLCLEKGKEHGIAFICANGKEQRQLEDYVVSIDEVEQKLQINLFCTVPAKLQEQVEAQTDLNYWKQ